MDRRSRSIDARRIAGALALALCTAGCGGDAYVAFSASGAPPAGVVSSGGTVYAATSSSASAFFMFAMVLRMVYADDRSSQIYMGTGIYPSFVPPMDEARKVNAQDCSKPIEDWSANLKCN